MRNLCFPIVLLFLSACGLEPTLSINSQLGTSLHTKRFISSDQCQKFSLKTPLDQMLNSHVATHLITGTLYEEISENFRTGYMQTNYYLKDDFGKNFHLEVDQMTLAKSLHLVGKKVNLEIKSRDQAYMMSSAHSNLKVVNIYEDLHQETSHQMIDPEIKVLAILVEFNNLATFTNFPMSQADDYIKHFSEYYGNVSRGRTNINVDLDGDGSADIAQLKLDMNHTGSTCFTNFFESLIDQIPDYDPNNYDKLMFFSISSGPYGGGHCPYAGVARRPGTISHIADIAYIVGIHEFGHNLGLEHASFDENSNGVIDGSVFEVYGDQSGIMGNNFEGEAHFNPPNSIELGLFNQEPGSILQVNESGIYQLDPLASDANASHPKIIKIGGNLSQYDLSMAYRGAVLEDTDIKLDYKNKLAIYDGISRENNSGYGSSGSAFYKAIAVNSPEYTEANSGLKIKFLSLNNQTAQVEITFPNSTNPIGNSCDKQGPSIQLKGYQQIASDSFELQFSIVNNNTDCSPVNFNMELDSQYFKLASGLANLSLMDGEEKNISLSINLESGLDLDYLTNLGGKLLFTEDTNTYEKSFEIKHDPNCVQ
jgi:hypothetical protein